jgi:hypothetical protein
MADDAKPVVEVDGYKIYVNAGHALGHGLETFKIVRPDGSVLVEEISRIDIKLRIQRDREEAQLKLGDGSGCAPGFGHMNRTGDGRGTAGGAGNADGSGTG